MSQRAKESLADPQIQEMLQKVTGHRYTFAAGAVRCWENGDNTEEDYTIGFFQLMPVSSDDGFFDAYCDQQPYRQFYRSKEDCVINFLYHWTRWIADKK